MGILPLQFKEGEGADSLGLTGKETFSFDFGGETVSLGQDVIVTASNGTKFVTNPKTPNVSRDFL
jgi:aconitate hydratase